MVQRGGLRSWGSPKIIRLHLSFRANVSNRVLMVTRIVLAAHAISIIHGTHDFSG